ncbi:hypothetical protein BH11PAT4_BH11PAT4_1060 [soil metagenome]
MSIKRLPVFLRVQLLLAVVVAVVLIVGDRSQPKIGKIDESLSVNQPIIVSFDRPMKKETVEKGFKLLGGGSEVKGTFSWSSRAAAFIPDEPLAYGTSYALSLATIEDMEGHVLRNQYSATVRTSEPRFAYMTPDFGLSLFNAASKQSIALSDKNEKILDYAVSSDGEWLLASFQDRQDEKTSGIFSMRLGQNGGSDKVTLYKGTDAIYSKVELCGPDSVAVVSRSDIDDKGLIEESGLVTFPLAEKGFEFEKQLPFLSSEEVPSANTLVCSSASDQVIYQSRTGNVVLGSLSEPMGDALGSYLFAFGFSPKGTTVLLGDTTSATLPTNRVAYAINDKGLREMISDNATDSAYPAYDPTEQILAIAEDVSDIGSEDNFRTHFKIVLRQRDRGTVTVRPVTEGSAETSDEHPTWSHDGRFLTFESIPREEGYERDRPRNNDGSFIDGEIWLTELKPGSNFLTREISTQPLKIKGSGVTWLP